MGASAEILSIRVTNDNGGTAGPLELDGASNIHYFDTDLNASVLRFEAIEASEGNTGAVEIEVYGEPLISRRQHSGPTGRELQHLCSLNVIHTPDGACAIIASS